MKWNFRFVPVNHYVLELFGMKAAHLCLIFMVSLFAVPGRSQTETLIHTLIERAQAGEADAQVDLGRAYEDGQGVPQDDTKAVQWFRKAAEQGNARGQNSLGVMCALGRGVERDREEAVRWYRKAAKGGLSEGFYNVAISYFNGEGVNEDLSLAYAYMLIAQSKGNPDAAEALRHISVELHGLVEPAKLKLAAMYEKGEDVPQDYAGAFKLYQELAATAPESGFAHDQAEFKICEFYALGRAVPQDFAQARLHCKVAAREGNRFAYVVLGRMAVRGLGSEANLKEAEEWFRMAAAAGDLEGVLELGRLKLQTGSHDAVQEAYFWFYVAGMQGVKEADGPLQKAAAQLSAKEQASVEKAYKKWRLLPAEDKKKKIKFR